MITKKYQLINNIGGWVVFIIALVTYWLTLEPTASYWDCGEFIIQADKLEVGHPPGNPIFMLTARFFANFASSPETVSLMVNAMSGLLSALTILLLFWTITHLVRRLTVRDSQTQEPSIRQYLAIMGSGLVGALAYCWSDTFWFSAVEGEVYAFSSFCTALVFWLILKWEDRADDPGADRWLILIAYIIGVSVAVHLLNLLCIPAIVLVFAYRKYKDMNLMKSIIALLISFAIIVLVLYGLVPGFIKAAQQFELFFVNTCGMSFNSGALIYAALTAVVFIWALWALYSAKNANMVRISMLVAVTLSGMLFFGNSAWIGCVLTVIFAAVLFVVWKKKLPMRWLNIAMWSIAVIFVGYSSYALILIRSSADTPMNQNSPDNVFDLAAYLNREQYGENPLLYGRTFNSAPMKMMVGDSYTTVVKPGKALYAKGVKGASAPSYGFLEPSDISRNAELERRGSDFYAKKAYDPEYTYNPELNMLFPRIYSPMHASMYGEWVRLDTVPDNIVPIFAIDEATGEKFPEYDLTKEPVENQMTGTISYPQKMAYKPTFSQNLAYFFNYQLNHMYMRYFMWNFAGRQNDLLNQHGELDAGNWISGIPFIDNPRLGDQQFLPDDLGKNNKGHNVYFMLPLLLGIIGLLWQAFAGRRGIEQFWVVFFLFFMTGIAIVLYLNQPPGQPRERDYAFAGSFYAFAIWIGMGVVGLWRVINYMLADKKDRRKPQESDIQPVAITDEPPTAARKSLICVGVACLIGILVPIQMVSQTWDDHDRSGRYAARDYGANYLESLEPNAIVFCNGDNDTFPLWYAQEVEGVRPDVKIINLSYLASDWYANQQRMQSYTAAPVKMTAKPADYAYNRLDAAYAIPKEEPKNLLDALKKLYSGNAEDKILDAKQYFIPVDKEAVIRRGLVAPEDTASIQNTIVVDIANAPAVRSKGYVSLSEILMLDIIATNAANGWERPIYWAMTVGPEYHLGLTPYLRSTGMTHQLVPTLQEGMPSRNDRAYDNVTRKYRWGGADAPAGKEPYFDETAARMLTSVRSSMLEVAQECLYQGEKKAKDGNADAAKAEYQKGVRVLDLMSDKLKASTMPYGLSLSMQQAQLYCEFAAKERLDSEKYRKKGLAILEQLIDTYSQYVVYNQRMAAQFINPSLTYESTLIPYQFYAFVELYAKFGGNMKAVEQKLKGLGINLEVLKSNYEAYMSHSDPAADTASASGNDAQALLGDIAAYSEIVSRLAAMSPEQYAAADPKDREIDSLFYHLIEISKEAGVSEADLQKIEAFKKVDMARSKRIADDFSARHPEIFQQ